MPEAPTCKSTHRKVRQLTDGPTYKTRSQGWASALTSFLLIIPTFREFSHRFSCSKFVFHSIWDNALTDRADVNMVFPPLIKSASKADFLNRLQLERDNPSHRQLFLTMKVHDAKEP
jgi:hypothetical protein